MKIVRPLPLFLSLLLGSCSLPLASLEQKMKPATAQKLPELHENLTADESFTLLIEFLSQRDPNLDAENVYEGIGYTLIFSYGGLRLPLGVNGDWASDGIKDFDFLSKDEIQMFEAIHTALTDPAGPLVPHSSPAEHQLLTAERARYHDVRYEYALKFNKKMLSIERSRSYNQKP